MKGIKKASPIAQTSCLEGFHSGLNQFVPKMIAYSYQEMYCRHIIAAVHFNNNLHREDLKNKDGSEQIKIVYPKFKNGEATARNVKVKPNYDYVEEVFNTFVDGQTIEKLKASRKELEKMAPSPMNTMLPKQPRKEATEAWRKRKSMVVQEVPGTLPVAQPILTDSAPKRARYCRTCKKPMKGHKNVRDCPRNMHD